MSRTEPSQAAILPQAAWIDALAAPVLLVVRERLRYVNAAAVGLLRAGSARELLGRSVQDFLHPLDSHRILARIQRAQTGQGDNPPTSMRVFDCQGGELTLVITSAPIDCDGETGVLATCLDMTERAAMEQRLRRTDEDFRRIMDTMQDVFYRTDAQGVTRYVCPAVKNVLGYSAEEIIGLPAAAFYPDPAERDALVAAIREHGFVRDFPGRMRRKDGVIIDISISTQALRDERGQYAGVEGIWRDITERKAMERELERLATRDHLTGLFGRRRILELLDEELERRRDRRSQAPLSILLMDLDHFKLINDTFGHAGGDQVLRQFVSTVHESRRGDDQFGRLGGEEFLLMLEGADADGARQLAERIRAAVQDRAYHVHDDSGVRLTVSIGCAHARFDDRRSSDLLERADRALYEAKRSGRNRVCP
ncbi:MAG: diguanylate cyclase [Betaproteobacteria bacterium]|nr:diguanylate cyclase [Betaproteobacteria bacterium]